VLGARKTSISESDWACNLPGAWVERFGGHCHCLDLIDLDAEFEPEADVNAKERPGTLVLGPTMG
jgi:hypothetical protein